jgi:hypothetical protein
MYEYESYHNYISRMYREYEEASSVENQDLKINNGETNMKYDNDKTQFALIPPEALEEIGRVLTFGSSKYGPNDWRHDGDCTEWSRTYSSIQRHLNAFWSGEDLDPETGLNHLSHAATQIIILMMHQKDGNTHMDDRYVPLEVPTEITCDNCDCVTPCFTEYSLDDDYSYSVSDAVVNTPNVTLNESNHHKHNDISTIVDNLREYLYNRDR